MTPATFIVNRKQLDKITFICTLGFNLFTWVAVDFSQSINQLKKKIYVHNLLTDFY